MTIREKLDLLAQSEDKNAAVMAAYEEGVTTGIASVVALMGMTDEQGIIIAGAAGAHIGSLLDAPCNEDLEDDNDE